MDGKTRSEILALGAFMGAAHVVSPDHLSALATLSAGLGVRWGLGHSLGMVGAAALLLLATWGVEHAAERRAEGLAWYCNALVGLVMIGVGLYGLKRQGDKRDGQLPVHHHSCGTSHSHKDHHHHHLCGGSSKDSSLALGVGVIHGLTHVVWVLPVLQMRAVLDAVAYLGAFVLTSTIVMGLFAAAWGSATRGRADMTRYLEMATSLLSLAIGIAWLVLLASGQLEESVFGGGHDHGDHGHGHDQGGWGHGH